MPQPGVGRIVKLAADAGIKQDLAHKYKQGHNGQAIGTENRIKILGNQI